jgi:uncharacterized membrane protein YcaP (DUF421 family)
VEAIIEVVIRSAIVYLFIILGIRIFGKKELSQLSVIDLVFILLISNAVQNAMVGQNVSLLGGVIAALTLFVLNYLLKNLFYRSKRINEWIQGDPLMLIYHGKVVPEHMAKAKISMSELEAAVREHGVEEIKEVDLAVLEVDGNISVLSDQFKKVTTKKRHAHKVVQGFS